MAAEEKSGNESSINLKTGELSRSGNCTGGESLTLVLGRGGGLGFDGGKGRKSMLSLLCGARLPRLEKTGQEGRRIEEKTRQGEMDRSVEQA